MKKPYHSLETPMDDWNHEVPEGYGGFVKLFVEAYAARKNDVITDVKFLVRVQKIIRAIVDKEREECANECEYIAKLPHKNPSYIAGAKESAVFIRGRTGRTGGAVMK